MTMNGQKDEETPEREHLERLHSAREKLYPEGYFWVKDKRYNTNDPRNDARLDSYWSRLRSTPAETYKEVLRATWDSFVFDLRRGRYLELKRICKALKDRAGECEERYVLSDHVEYVIYFRRRILENVLWEHEVFGVAPYFDSLDAELKRNVVASAVSDEVQRFLITVTDPEMRHDFIGEEILPKGDNWKEKFALYEKMCDEAELPPDHKARYSGPESMKTSYNTKLRQSRE